MTSFSKRISVFVILLALAAGAGLLGVRAMSQGGVHSVPTRGEPDAQGNDATLQARRGIAEMGSAWDAEVFSETVRLYTDVHNGTTWPGILEPETIQYGPDREQTLMLIRPEQDFSELTAVVVFLFGNGLERDDSVTEQTLDGANAIFGRVSQFAALFGGLGIAINYRTGNDAASRSGAEDVQLALEWVQDNIESYSGDPNGVILIANSLGATHAASYLFNESLHSEEGPALASAILSSGLFGEEVARDLESLVNRYEGPRVPLALWVAQYDTPAVKAGVHEFYAQLCRKYDECPTLESIEGHNHLSHAMSFGTSDTTAQDLFIKFFHTSGADL